MKYGIAGSGNAAYHFCKMLGSVGHTLTQVYTRNDDGFATEFKAQRVVSPNLFSDENEIVFIAVSDSAIVDVAKAISQDIFTVHTSGITPISVLPQNHKGVVWPVQSLSKKKEVVYSEIPFLIEASDALASTKLQTLFEQISPLIKFATGEQRAKTHLAAVFANNFANHLFEISEKLLKESGFKLELLMPMIREQVEKISRISPHDAQTGPAIRADYNTIHAHLKILELNPELKEIYTILTNSILLQFHGKKL